MCMAGGEKEQSNRGRDGFFTCLWFTNSSSQFLTLPTSSKGRVCACTCVYVWFVCVLYITVCVRVYSPMLCMCTGALKRLGVFLVQKRSGVVSIRQCCWQQVCVLPWVRACVFVHVCECVNQAGEREGRERENTSDINSQSFTFSCEVNGHGCALIICFGSHTVHTFSSYGKSIRALSTLLCLFCSIFPFVMKT